MDEEYITLKRAAHIAGYSSADILRTAARDGRLKVHKPDKGALLTTRAWLEDYRQTLSPGSRHRSDYTASIGDKPTD